MIKELYGRLQDKYSARMQGISQLENKNFKPRTQKIAQAIYKGEDNFAVKSDVINTSDSKGLDSNDSCNCKM